tara:strand:+ start:635 stop:856 length:222 start_codon:yes stop_codon:yes gene_type:complete
MACLIELTLMGQHDGEDHGVVVVNMDQVEHFRTVKESEVWMTELYFKGYELFVKENPTTVRSKARDRDNNHGN